MKHIDSEKLKAEIERLIKVNKELTPRDFTQGIAAGYADVLSFIESLEKEPKCKTNPLFEDCLAEVNPDVRKEVRENIDKMLEKEQDCLYGYSPENRFCDDCSSKLCEARKAPKIKGWVVRENPKTNKALYFFTKKPHRKIDIFGVGYWACGEGNRFRIPQDIFPEMGWEDNPRECELSIKLL